MSDNGGFVMFMFVMLLLGFVAGAVFQSYQKDNQWHQTIINHGLGRFNQTNSQFEFIK